MKVFFTSALVLGLFVAIVTGGFLIFGSGLISKEKHGKVFVKGQEFNVEIADNPMKRSRGLSGREKLEINEGMLFLFSNTGYQAFWMKRMRIPIDIIWIKEDRIVGFERNIQPEPGVRTANLKRYVSPEAVEKVLEVPAGTVERLGIEVGDEIAISYN